MTAAHVNGRALCRGVHAESDDPMTNNTNNVVPLKSLKTLAPRSTRPLTLVQGRHSAGQCPPAAGNYQQPNALVGNTPVLRISAPLTSADRGFWAKLDRKSVVEGNTVDHGGRRII